MKTIPRWKIALAALAACALAAGLLQAASPAQSKSGSVSFNAVIEKVDAAAKTVDVEAYTLDVSKASISGAARRVEDLKPGQFVQTSGTLQPGGTVRAASVRVLRKNPGASFHKDIAKASTNEVAKIRKSDKLVKDEEMSAYVSRVGMSLVPEWAKSRYEFEFNVIEDPEVNAFAYPTGKIFVYTGLLGRVENEAQLAAVLGHEIGHVTQHHGERNYKSALWKTTVFLGVSLVLGHELEKQGASDATAYMATLGLNLGYMAAVNGYGRNMEDQSDRVGLRYMHDAGYDLREAPKVWDLFNSVYGDTPTAVNVFYGNHSTNRLRKKNQDAEIALLYKDLPPGRIEQGPYQERMVHLTFAAAKHDFAKQRWEPARTELERVLRLRPDHEEAQALLAKLNEKQKKTGSADKPADSGKVS